MIFSPRFVVLSLSLISSTLAGISCPASNGASSKIGDTSFTIECGKDHNRGDLKGLYTNTFEDCLETCKNTTDCVGVSYVPGRSNGPCYLKKAWRAASDNSKVWSASINAAAPGGPSLSSSTPSSSSSVPSLGTTMTHPNYACYKDNATGVTYVCPSSTCCSSYGWCGDSDAHCGSGCNPLFGSCNGTASSSSSSNSSSSGSASGTPASSSASSGSSSSSSSVSSSTSSTTSQISTSSLMPSSTVPTTTSSSNTSTTASSAPSAAPSSWPGGVTTCNQVGSSSAACFYQSKDKVDNDGSKCFAFSKERQEYLVSVYPDAGMICVAYQQEECQGGFIKQSGFGQNDGTLAYPGISNIEPLGLKGKVKSMRCCKKGASNCPSF